MKLILSKNRKKNIAKQRRKAAVYISDEPAGEKEKKENGENCNEIHHRHTEAIDQIYLEIPAINNIRELKKDIHSIQHQILRSEVLSTTLFSTHVR